MSLTAMGGLLTRTDDGWRWRDGRPEPRVRDLTASEAFQLPRVTYPDPARPGERLRYVSISPRALREDPDLRDVLPRGRPAPHEPGTYEVPESDWDAWARTYVVGVLWDAADEEALFTLAESLRASRA